MIRVGMGQMTVLGGEIDKNLNLSAQFIKNAAQQQCDLIVLPECLDTGWTHTSATDLAEPIPGSTSEILCQAARDNKIYVVAGITERHNNRIYNAAILIDSDGQVLLRHRKINILGMAQDLYSTGDHLSVVETPWGITGLNICADNFPQTSFYGQALAGMGAQLILSPCAWAVNADHNNQKDPYGQLWIDAYTRLAIDHQVAVIGVSNVGWITDGPWKGKKCIGCSLAVDQTGKIIKQAGYGESEERLEIINLEI